VPESVSGDLPVNNATDDALQTRLHDTKFAQPLNRVIPQCREAYLVYIYPMGPAMGSRYALNRPAMVLGRGDNCDLVIADNSVSRSHASIERTATGHMVIDLNSTNGTFVNDVAIARAHMQDGDYVRAGNCLFRFLAGDNVETAYHEEIYRLTIIDALTDIHNKRYLMEVLESELSRALRHERPLALVMMDIDHFKAINDRLQHLGGDFTLRELAACIKRSVRQGDLLARYGGEEFVLVLPETSREGALCLAEQLRKIVETHPFRYEDQTYYLTISLGVATTTGAALLTTAEFLRQADERLYEAKELGRNRVVA
jgi:diguanylate cyclase (GGDEF)-like protein